MTISFDATNGYSYSTSTGANATSGTSNSTSANGINTTSAADQQDRFLKLLVAQMTHQDPMNPVDNAQMTSQIAQINTVTGIQQLNTTMQTMASQFSSMQLMQGGDLIGHEVLTAGDTMTITTGTGTSAGKATATGTFDLPSNAADVKVQITDASGSLVATVPMGTQSAGRHDVTWDASSYKGTGPLKFTVTAKNGSASVTPTTYSHDVVSSVGTSNGALAITLQNGGTVSYDKIVSVY